MRPLRIASFFRTLGTGGDEARLLHLARAADRRRCEHLVAVAFPPHPDDDLGPMLDEYRAAGLEVVHLADTPEPRPAPRGERPDDAVRRRLHTGRVMGSIVAQLARLLRDRRVDLLDAHLAPAIPTAVLASRLAQTPVVGTQYHFAGWEGPARRAIARAFWPRLDALICDSQVRLDELRAFVDHAPPGVVIPNGIAAPSSARSAVEMRRALGLPESPSIRVIGQVSRLVPFKGQAVLLEAARAVLDQAPDTAFLICGFERDAAFAADLRRRARELGIADRVRVLGYHGPIADVWQAIDVHVHPTLFDSSPIAILEGMALGRPAVVTAVGGIPELVAHEESGLLVPPNDPAALAAALLRLLKNPSESERFGAAAQARWRARHRPEVMAGATLDLFESLLARRAAVGLAPARA